MITICLTYYKSLTLANLEAALFSVRQQNLLAVAQLVVFDNDTVDMLQDIQEVIDKLAFPIPVNLISVKHGSPLFTHAWSTNCVVRAVSTPWVLFTRADYLLEFDAVDRFLVEAQDENRFIVGGYYDIGIDIDRCEQTDWRERGPSVLRPFGREFDHTLIDSGVWMTRKETFDQVGGMEESLSAWGHAQTYFQYKLHLAGVNFVQIPYVVFYHPAHGYETPRDHNVAQQQLINIGVSVTDMWARYTGSNNPYR